MQALVTGCAGFIGSTLSEALTARGVEVRGVDCFNDNYERDLKERNLEDLLRRESFAFHEADLGTVPLEALVDGVDVIFHLAGEPGVRSSWAGGFARYLHNNVLATQRLLETALQARVPRVVYASSSSIYGQAERYPTSELTLPRPHSPYGVTKLGAEQLACLYADNYGLSTVSLRYFSVYGPRQRPDMGFNRFCRAVLDGRAIEVYGDGEQTRDFTYVDDIVNATMLAGEADVAPGTVLNVGGGSEISINETLALLEAHVGEPIEVNYRDAVAGDVRVTKADSTEIRAQLGWEPTVSVQEGLPREYDWMAALLATRRG